MGPACAVGRQAVAFPVCPGSTGSAALSCGERMSAVSSAAPVRGPRPPSPGAPALSFRSDLIPARILPGRVAGRQKGPRHRIKHSLGSLHTLPAPPAARATPLAQASSPGSSPSSATGPGLGKHGEGWRCAAARSQLPGRLVRPGGGSAPAHGASAPRRRTPRPPRALPRQPPPRQGHQTCPTRLARHGRQATPPRRRGLAGTRTPRFCGSARCGGGAEWGAAPADRFPASPAWRRAPICSRACTRTYSQWEQAGACRTPGCARRSWGCTWAGWGSP